MNPKYLIEGSIPMWVPSTMRLSRTGGLIRGREGTKPRIYAAPPRTKPSHSLDDLGNPGRDPDGARVNHLIKNIKI